MKFGFVAKHRGAWPVNLMCEALGVSRGGFYAWLTRPRSQRSLSDEVLGAQVHQSFVRSDRTYGATCWSKVKPVVCTASSDSCESRHYEPGPDDVDCPRTGARAARWPITCWTASSGPMARTRSG